MKFLVVTAAVLAIATPVAAQTAREGNEAMNRAGMAAAELTMLLGLCKPNLSDNHWTQTRTSLIEELGLEASDVDRLYNRAVAERANLTAEERDLYSPLDCRIQFNQLTAQVNNHLAEASRHYLKSGTFDDAQREDSRRAD